MKFDENGYILPYEPIILTINQLENTFGGNSEIRIELWKNFLNFINDLQTVTQMTLLLWINGSFTTLKTNPNDIDIVVFLDYEILESKEKELNIFRSLPFYKLNKIDVYFVGVYPDNHPFYYLYQLTQKEWLFNFSQTNPNKTGKICKKGFVELKLETL